MASLAAAALVALALSLRRQRSARRRLPSEDSVAAASLAEDLQRLFVGRLERIAPSAAKFTPASWLRAGGAHGGGTRYETTRGVAFNRASVNVSAVHFESRVKYPIDSATAFSVILHPRNPHAPSMHFHLSFVESRRGGAYWRLIADLNPSISDPAGAATFSAAVAGASGLTPALHAASCDFGERYFYIAPLERHRGAAHFFAASVRDSELDAAQARVLGRSLATRVLEAYAALVERAVAAHPETTLSAAEWAAQRAYHTVYFFQVLLLDRGTTYGVLAHADNDVGTLGSLPSLIDADLLESWRPLLPAPQDELLDAVLSALELAPTRGQINDAVRQALADALRAHYKSHPEAKDLQAEFDLPRWNAQAEERIAAATATAARCR